MLCAMYCGEVLTVELACVGMLLGHWADGESVAARVGQYHCQIFVFVEDQDVGAVWVCIVACACPIESFLADGGRRSPVLYAPHGGKEDGVSVRCGELAADDTPYFNPFVLAVFK